MQIAGIVFLSLFAAMSVVHIFFCYREQELLRKITKPFCVLFLGLAAIFFLPNNPLVYIGAFLGVGGDILLIKKENKLCFTAGAVLFIGGHLCYFVQIIKVLTFQVPWFVYVIIGLVLLCVTLGLYPVTKKYFKSMAFGVNFYIPLLVVMFAIGLTFAINASNHLPGTLIAIGYLMFIVSDCLLIYTTFIKDKSRRDFYIMFTYLLAELLIVGGFILFLK